MELKGERLLAADRATAWAALNDIEVLQRCVPGCESFVATGENQYEVQMTAAVGPVKSKFKGRIELKALDAPNGYTMVFDGTGGMAGFARGDAQVALQAVDAASTRLSYVVNAHVGGKLAQVGSRLIDAAAGAMSDKFFEAFGAQLAARVPSGAPAPATPPPAAGFGLWSLLVAFFRRLFARR